MQRPKHAFYRKLVLLLIVLFVQLNAQVEQGAVMKVKYAYDQLRFSEAIARAKPLLVDQDLLTPGEMVFLHQYVALAFFNLGQMDSAQVHFSSALSVRPSLSLDEADTSPKIIEFFEKIKLSLTLEDNPSSTLPFTRYKLIDDRRSGAVLRSAVMPGWGQLYKEQTGKAVVFASFFWASFGAAGYSFIRERSAKDAYGAARDPADIAVKYQAYNDWYQRRRNFALLSGAIWAATFVDAALSHYLPDEVQFGSDGVQFGWRFAFNKK